MTKWYIKKSMSSSAVLVLLVPKKKDEILRMHVDCRTSNNIMVKYRHSISSLDNILNGFHRSYMFSKIDFKWINEPYFV
jgi:hypothetical protein